MYNILNCRNTLRRSISLFPQVPGSFLLCKWLLKNRKKGSCSASLQKSSGGDPQVTFINNFRASALTKNTPRCVRSRNFLPFPVFILSLSCEMFGRDSPGHNWLGKTLCIIGLGHSSIIIIINIILRSNTASNMRVYFLSYTDVLYRRQGRRI